MSILSPFSSETIKIKLLKVTQTVNGKTPREPSWTWVHSAGDWACVGARGVPSSWPSLTPRSTARCGLLAWSRDLPESSPGHFPGSPCRASAPSQGLPARPFPPCCLWAQGQARREEGVVSCHKSHDHNRTGRNSLASKETDLTGHTGPFEETRWRTFKEREKGRERDALDSFVQSDSEQAQGQDRTAPGTSAVWVLARALLLPRTEHLRS